MAPGHERHPTLEKEGRLKSGAERSIDGPLLDEDTGSEELPATACLPTGASKNVPKSVPATKLETNALGLLATSALTAAYMGPALSIYCLFGPMSEKVGSGVGFVMFLGLLMTLPSAISFGMLAKEMPSAGGVYAWARAALGESVGLWIGLTTVGYYIVCVIFPPIVFGQYFNDLLQQCGLPANVWTWLIGVIALLLVTGSVTYRGIVISSEIALTMLLIECAVVVALAGTFIGLAVVHGTFTWAPFTFSGCKGGWSSVFLVLPMVMLSMACDGATPAAEETRNARRTMPIAVVLTCTIVGLWYVLGYSAFALAMPPADAAVLASQTYASAVTPLAGQAWGSCKILVAITAMTAAMGAAIPGAIAASRVLFAMSRDGKLPGRFPASPAFSLALERPAHRVWGDPARRSAGAIYGPNRGIDFWAGISGWYIAIVYVSVNVASIVFFWRFHRAKFHVAWNLLMPVVGIAAQVLVIWQSIIVELWNSGTLGHCAQGLIVLVSVITAVYVGVHRMRRRDEPSPLGPEYSADAQV